MSEKLSEHLDLNNGLTVRIYDLSRKVAGNRWLVKLAARIDVPVPSDPIPLKNGDTVSGTELQEALGKHVQFEFSSERNFIHEKELKPCFEHIKASFLQNTKPYLAHADFQRSFILKKYREYLGQKRLYS